jgi:hypothetical protein
LHLLSLCTNFSHSWVRVFEVGSKRIAKADAIEAGILTAERDYVYWQRLWKAFWSDPTVLEKCSLDWKNAASSSNTELVKARAKYAEAYTVWMDCKEIE